MTTGAAPALSVRDLRKSYGATVAVGGVSFDVARGECFGLLLTIGVAGFAAGSIILARRDR